MPQSEGISEPLDEDHFDAVGLPPWEAQKLRNKEERKVIAKVMQDRMQEAIADLQRGEEAAEQPEQNVKRPQQQRSQKRETKVHATRRQFAETGNKATAKEATSVPLPMAMKS